MVNAIAGVEGTTAFTGSKFGLLGNKSVGDLITDSGLQASLKTGFFDALDEAGIAWGFVSGAEPPSARYVLQQRLGLSDPPLIAMGDAPDKPDPTGLLRLAHQLAGPLGAEAPPVAYLGDTVADVQTVVQARQQLPEQRFLALAVAPPHLQASGNEQRRHRYEEHLRQAGADAVIAATDQVLRCLEQVLQAV